MNASCKKTSRRACCLSWRESLAVLLTLGALSGLVLMITAEGHVGLPPQATTMATILTDYLAHVLPNLQLYSLAFGAILVLASLSWILLGHQEEIATSLTESGPKK